MVTGFYRFTFLLLLTCAIVTGCKPQSLPPIPDVSIVEKELNKDFQILAPDGWNTFRINEGIGLVVRVLSEEMIMFPADFGARVFYLQDREWIEAPNITEYPNNQVLLSTYVGNFSNEGVVDLFPVFPEDEEELTVRILLVGNFYRDNQITTEQTGGYIDLQLTR